MLARVQVDAVGPLREEVHGRRAEQLELRGLEVTLQARVRAREDHEEVEGIAGAAPRRGCDPADLDEEETVREGEVLVEKTVPLERAWAGREHGVLVV